MNLLDILIAVPFVGFAAVLLVPKSNAGAAKMIALVVALAVFLGSLALIGPVIASKGDYEFVTNINWIQARACSQAKASSITSGWTESASGWCYSPHS